MKKRLFAMLAVDAICAVIAVAAAIGVFSAGIAWLQWVLVAALLAGFAAQIWFIAGLRPAKKGV
jgi:hypothetical protein